MFSTPKPTKMVLAWDVPITEMDRQRARGINVLISAGMVGKKDQAELAVWAAAAAGKGLWVIVDNKGLPQFENQLAFLLPDEMDAKQADKAIPKWDGLTRAQIRPLYDAAKVAYPNLPVFMSLAGDHVTLPNRTAYYTSVSDCCDIWMSDGYPRSKNGNRYDETLWPGQATKILKSIAPNKPCVAMIETCNQHLKNAPFGRDPQPAETNAAIDQALANGADHLGVFTHVFDGNDGWVSWDGTRPEIDAVLTDRFHKFTGDSPTDRPIDAIVAQLNGQVASLTQQLIDQSKRVTALENRKIVVSYQ